jgi:surface protein
MKKSIQAILFSLVFLTSPLCLMAQQVSRDAAMTKALAFLTEQSTKPSAARGTVNKAPQLVLANNSEEIYIFNDEANGGYVVVSGDERMPDVLGYSLDGHYDADNIPCNMKAWLDGYAEQVIYLRNHPEANVKPRKTEQREEVSPLLRDMEWHQKYPFNCKCPLIEGEERAATGCTATAMAMIMYYHKWPKQTTDIIPGYTTRTLKIEMPDMPITEIDWDNMFDDYRPYFFWGKECTKEQEDAISTLMFLCGTSVKMDYNYLSGASLDEAKDALRLYFDYDDFVEGVGRSDFELEEWENIIYEELGNGRPVLYSGFKENYESGHAFVVDGYRDGYFHLNWGTNFAYLDDSDHYFLMMSDVDMPYSRGQYAVVGIQPAMPNSPRPYAVFDDGKLTLYYDQEIDNRQGTVIPHVRTCYDITKEIREKITECVIDKSFNNKRRSSLADLFYGCTALKSIKGIENLNTENVTDMSCMFYGCSGLTSLDVSGFKTDNVKYMGGMFFGCSGLTSLDVSNFRTDNVTEMADMFRGCSGLTSLDVSGFKTDNVRYMTEMFHGCSRLTSLDVSGFNTENVTYMGGMFQGCSGLTSLDLSGFKTDNVTDMRCMFSGCSNLTSLNLSGFKTDNVTSMGYMFCDCSGLTSLDLSGFRTDNVSNMWEMFSGCSALTSLDLSGFKTDNVTSMNRMFYRCSALTSLDVSGFKTDNVTYMEQMFYYCSALTSLDVSGFRTNNVTHMKEMFSGCSSLTSLDLSGFRTDNVTDMDYMFWNCSGLKSLDLSGFKTDNITHICGMFHDCSGLTSLDVSGFKTDNVTDLGGLFYGCSGLTSLDVSGFNTENVTNMSLMFQKCSGLTSLDVSGFKTDNVTDMSCMFYGCSGLPNLDLSGFNTNNVTYMNNMFCYCSGLTSLDLSGFKTDNVTDMSGMFDFSSLTTIYASERWNTANVNNQYDDMFFCCYNLVGGAGTKYSVYHTGLDYARIDGGPDNPGYFTYKEPPSQKQKKGDVNVDGKVNGTDIQTVINVIVDEDYVEEADVNNDNKVNGTDIQEIINIIVEEE